MSELTASIRERYLQVRERIDSTAISAGRDPKSIRLVVVTKTQPVEVVQAVIEAGAQILGENYPEEAVGKLQFLGPRSGVEWHMIGHIQSRKAGLVAANFNLVHSLDSLKLAERLDRFSGELDRSLPVLLEFNVGGEQTKAGWNAADEDRWEALLAPITSILALPNLLVQGLMVMPPLGTDPEDSRPYFQRAKRLRDRLCEKLPGLRAPELSMGTSLDFEIAVEEGATLVRVGTAITGPRKYDKER